MQRRRFLAGLSTTLPLALAGCTNDGTGNSNTTDATTTQETTQTTQSTTDTGAQLGDDRTLDVVGADATAFVVTSEDSEPRVQSQRNARQVLVTFAADGVDDPEQFVAENVVLTVNGDHEYADPVFPEGGDASEFDAAYAVPSDVTPYGATVELDTGDTTHSWEFDARDIESITQAVEYEVTNVSVPDTVAPEAAFGAELEVDNAGDAIEFTTSVAATADAPRVATFDVPAGETVTRTLDLTAPANENGEDDFPVELHWGANGFVTVVPYE